MASGNQNEDKSATPPLNGGYDVPDRRFVLGLLIYGGFMLLFQLLLVGGGFAPQVRSLSARTRADLRSVASGLESYRLDHGIYPKTEAEFKCPGLTTPVAYISSNPADAFKRYRYDLSQPERRRNPRFQNIAAFVYFVALFFEYALLQGWRIAGMAKAFIRFAYIPMLAALPIYLFPFLLNGPEVVMPRPVANAAYEDKPHSFDYFTDGKDFWVLRSLGPNGVADLADLSRLETDFNNDAIGAQWIPYCYDPSNGVISGGDMFRFTDR